VAAADAFEQTVDAFINRLVALAPLAARGNKQALLGIEGRSMAEQLDHEAVIQATAIGSTDFREGLAATREKREPVFEGN